MSKKYKIMARITGALTLAIAAAGPVGAVDLREAVQAALTTNPEISQAVRNREAIDQEREQAQGLYGPRITLETSAGVRRLENTTRRTLGIADDTLYPVEVDVLAEQVLIDFGRNRGELSRQAARTDGAAQRVEERSEFVALNVSRAYFDFILQQRIVAAAQDNLAFHERLVGDLREGVSRGSISLADQQQAEERLQAARARLTEALEEQENAAIRFHQIAGLQIGQPTMPTDISGRLPTDVDQAVNLARANNPRVLEALADLDARSAERYAAHANLFPRISAEGRYRGGDDIDGFRGHTEDYLARVVLRWTLFSNGINMAQLREATSRESEQRARLDQVGREAEADVRTAWNRLESQTRLVPELEQQSRVSDDLLISYREQFNVGRRSLLDVLDAQNTRYNVQVQAETARLAQLYAQYRVLAASNLLIEALGVDLPSAAISNMRERHGAVRTNNLSDVMEPRTPYGPSNN